MGTDHPIIRFVEKDHTYWDGEKQIHSPTDVFSCVGTRKSPVDSDGNTVPFNSLSGMEWYNDAVASLFGREFHIAAKLLAKGKQVECDPNMMPWIDGLKLALEREDILQPAEELVAELVVYHKAFGYAGTLDIYNPVKNVVIDWKTATSWAEHWWWQTAAYAEAVKRERSLKQTPTTAIIQVIPKSYVPKRHSAPQVRSDFGIWLSILNTYKRGTK